jgi:hypothetical protein
VGTSGLAVSLTQHTPACQLQCDKLLGRYIDPPLDDHLALSSKGTRKTTVDYLGRFYGCILDGRTSIISGNIETVTGHPPRSFVAFVEENKKAW